MSFILKDFKQLDKYCNQENDYVYGKANSGYAYQYKKSEVVYCLEYCDLNRGRGKPEECRKAECQFYIFIDPNQMKLPPFFVSK